MFKKINAKEKVVGWYSTGPKIRPADLEINELIRKYTAEPLLIIIDVDPKDNLEIPVEAYLSVENVPEKKSKNRRTFKHLPAEIGAYEAEEVGVEHLLREIRDTTGSSIADKVSAKVNSLKGLHKRLQLTNRYLDNVIKGVMVPNQQIIYQLQDILNLIPDLKESQKVKAFSENTNDNFLTMYISGLIRAILSLHNLIINKLQNQDAEKKEETLSLEKSAKEAATKEAAAKAATEAGPPTAAGDPVPAKTETKVAPAKEDGSMEDEEDDSVSLPNKKKMKKVKSPEHKGVDGKKKKGKKKPPSN